MSKFYMRVFKDDKRERTYGCGSRDTNTQNYLNYELGLINAGNRYRKDPKRYYGTQLGKRYRVELVRNRHGEKKVYRTIEFILVIPPIESIMTAHIIVCKDMTHNN